MNKPNLKWEYLFFCYLVSLPLSLINCTKFDKNKINTAEMILGNNKFPCIAYGGYRGVSRDKQPTIEELKEDMLILSAMGIKLIRTYNVHLPHAKNVLEAITSLKKDNPEFEMYVMLGAWIDAKNAWTELPTRIRDMDSERNAKEIETAIQLINQYPDIVKVVSIGNEAMVHWATQYYVEPSIVLNWVRYIQGLKRDGMLPNDLWVTSSDNYASWGGGGKEYHKVDLNNLIKEVDFISIHTYPMHDTHYNPEFWGNSISEEKFSKKEKIDAAISRAVDYAVMQYNSVKDYVAKIDPNKPIHIGETGWATYSNEFYGSSGSKATDEYKSGLYFRKIIEWSKKNKISVFYFEAFDEKWKDAKNPGGSENYFGLFTEQGEAKFALWESFDSGIFDGLYRGKNAIQKTYDGNLIELLKKVEIPPKNKQL